MSLTQLCYEGPHYQSAAQALAQRLNLTLTEPAEPPPAGDHLWLGPALELVSPDCGRLKLDFIEGALEHRRKFGGGELLIKACGRPQTDSDWLLDLTAGCGRDSFVAVNHGWRVQMCERNPLVHALLADALHRAHQQNPELFDRLNLQPQSAQQVLASLAPEQRPAVIYLDPMFPHRAKTAKVKKDMQLLQRYVGPDADADELLLLALPQVLRRVVVKRPDSAPYLAQKSPSYSLASRGHRFDVYQQG